VQVCRRRVLACLRLIWPAQLLYRGLWCNSEARSRHYMRLLERQAARGWQVCAKYLQQAWRRARSECQSCPPGFKRATRRILAGYCNQVRRR
jgi:hypothetical protein